jgi:hypothetical protein
VDVSFMNIENDHVLKVYLVHCFDEDLQGVCEGKDGCEMVVMLKQSKYAKWALCVVFLE